MRKLILTATMLLAAGCAVDHDSSLSISGGGPGFVPSPPTNTTCNDFGNSDTHWQKNTSNEARGFGKNMFHCGETIRISNQTGIVTSAQLNSAIQIWNSGVLNAYNLPQFSSASGSGPTVTMSVTGSGNNYCGSTEILNSVVTIIRSTDTLCSYQGNLLRAVSGANSGDVTKLVAHELGHALGFKGHFVTGPGVYTEQHVGKCINTVAPDFNSPKPLNGAVCEHEKQLIYFAYGLQPNDPDPGKDFVMSLTVNPVSIALNLNASAGVSIVNLVTRGQDADNDVNPAPTDVFSWALQSVTPSGAFTITSTSGTATTVNATSTAGSATLVADLMSTAGYNIAWPFGKGVIPIVTLGPTAPPSNLSVSNILSTSATLGWTNGDATATTTVQSRLTGNSTWITATSVAPGVNSYGLGGLTACSQYDVRLYHVKNTLLSPYYTVPGAFRTPAASGACAPANFQIASCFTTTSGGKTYRSYNVQWVQREFSFHATSDIGQASTNNPASASVIYSGSSSTTTATLGPYLAQTGSYTLYFWVRHKLAGGTPSAWVALYDNPVDPTQPC